jgi:hypothetical protein
MYASTAVAHRGSSLFGFAFFISARVEITDLAPTSASPSAYLFDQD